MRTVPGDTFCTDYAFSSGEGGAGGGLGVGYGMTPPTARDGRGLPRKLGLPVSRNPRCGARGLPREVGIPATRKVRCGAKTSSPLRRSFPRGEAGEQTYAFSAGERGAGGGLCDRRRFGAGLWVNIKKVLERYTFCICIYRMPVIQSIVLT